MPTLPTTSPIPFWVLSADPNAGQWDVCALTINGIGKVTLPGIASMSTVLENEYQVPKNNGTDLVNVTYKGLKPRRFTLTQKITGAAQWNVFQSVIKQLSLDALGKSKSPYGITHPYADTMGVQFVVIEKINLPAPNAKSVYLPTFQLIEWVNTPPPTKTSPPGATFGQGGFATAPPFTAERP